MKKLLEFLTKSIVEYPKEVKIEEEDTGDYINFKLQTHPDDLKIVIGKGGQTINALRQLLKVKAFKSQKKISIEIVS